MKLKLLAFFFLCSIVSVFGQQFQLSEDAKVSVLTIGPGESLNDAFGHNGFRIKDNALGIDVVYGYGEYDFEAPNFYLKFAQGKLNYLISRHNFKDLLYHYSISNRTINEQVLNLSSAEKQNLFNYLENNYKPENRRYLYDFFYDNCATRIRDIAQTTTTTKIDFKTPENFEPKTFRTLIHDHVGLNSWGSFGIDIALGSVIDRKASVTEHMFLPEYIHTFFENATINGNENLVQNSTTLYQKKESKSALNWLFSPLVIIGLIALIMLYITYKDAKNNTRTKWLDLAIFGTTGLIGVLILFLWFGTDHSATAHNYNLLWAFPLNIIVMLQLLKPQVKKWITRYLKFLIIMFALMTFHWIGGVQVFAIGLIPIVIALLIRYLYLIKWFNKDLPQ
ncbi:DUF4105 domain-containing protein [Winogradskyella sp. F6397]|uniref:DUF4105 domain-containing protein n=1 Tax=Winogradskyella marina TaxID=2785530 RepID=A0ABS0EKK9_9FLAO|nr:DUF4105 domain-containing protein [Winogradskyella marina]MBF8150998.1 DUF4105 domain-containing protein [Winogradskyella marina]